MKMERADLTRLRQPLTGFGFALAGAAMLATWSWQQVRQAENGRDAARRDKNRMEQRLQQAIGEENELRERAALYQKLQNNGTLGRENRLAGLEMLQQMSETFALRAVAYELAPPVRLDTPATPPPNFVSSALHLQFKARDEEELLRVLAHIESTAPALNILRSCRLSRISGPGEAGDLDADCRLDWLNIETAKDAQ